MLLIDNFSQVAAQIESERGITKDDLIQAIEQALVSACRKKFPEGTILEAKLDPESGEATIWKKRTVVKKIEDELTQVLLAKAKKIKKDIKDGEDLLEPVVFSEFGRIAAQTAKQVIIQRIREAEKNSIYNEFKPREGQIITGVVQRKENRNYLINLGRIEAVLNLQDQIPGEDFNLKDRIKLYIAEVSIMSRGPNIRISRTHEGLLKNLFESEVPEIQDGIIQIVSVARDPGKRAKIAVKSNNPNIGAVGTCVGPMGNRIQTVIRELGNEKIDILEFEEDPKKYIANSLKPAKIKEVIINNKEEKNATVVVAKDQLSLAIGKGGINVRLAVKLTGWRLDILSEEDYAKSPEDKETGKMSFVDKIKRDTEKLKQEGIAKTEEVKVIEPKEEIKEEEKPVKKAKAKKKKVAVAVEDKQVN